MADFALWYTVLSNIPQQHDISSLEPCKNTEQGASDAETGVPAAVIKGIIARRIYKVTTCHTPNTPQ